MGKMQVISMPEVKPEKTDREKRIDTEYKRIKTALKNLPKDTWRICEKLAREAAYLTAIIGDARAEIDREGIIEEYKNGENQFGRKKNPAVEVHDRAVNSYAKIIKQLTDLMPDAQQAVEAGEALRAFIRSEK